MRARGIEAEKDVPFERVSERVGRVAVPLPFFSVPVNVWVVLAERPLLVDTGPRTDDARARVEAGLAAMGTRVEDLAHVFITHFHADHSGLLHEWVARSRATALVHEDDLEATLDVAFMIEKRLSGYREAGARWGLAPDEAAALAEHVRGFATDAGVTPRDRARAVVGERTPLEVPGVRLTALHVPGHTEGQALLFDEDAHVLYAGDHVLERITPNPNLYVPPYRGRDTGLAHALASLAGLRALPADTLVCPGHGAPFRGLHARLEAGPRTVVALVREIWKDLPAGDLALGAREVHGHLDILEEEGLVAREDRGGAWSFRRLP